MVRQIISDTIIVVLHTEYGLNFHVLLFVAYCSHYMEFFITVSFYVSQPQKL